MSALTVAGHTQLDIVCNFNIGTENTQNQCPVRFQTADAFNTHVERHLSQQLPTGRCKWIGCSKTINPPREYMSHMHDHMYHQVLIALGTEFIQSNNLQLQCQQGIVWNDGIENHPDLDPVNDMECVLLGCTYMGRFRSRKSYHDHVNDQVDMIAQAVRQAFNWARLSKPSARVLLVAMHKDV